MNIGKGRQVIWPVYLDSTKSRKQGRRIPRSIAVESPKLQEIEQATRLLGYVTQVKLDSAYPKMGWEKKGCVLVEKRDSKNKVLRKIAERINALRKEASIKK